MNRSVVNAVSVIGKMGGAEWHFPDDKKMGKAVTGLESESVTAHEVSNKNKNVDVICLATSDSGYIETIEKLRLQGKRVVVIGEKKSSEKLRRSCSRFIEV